MNNLFRPTKYKHYMVLLFSKLFSLFFGEFPINFCNKHSVFKYREGGREGGREGKVTSNTIHFT